MNDNLKKAIELIEAKYPDVEVTYIYRADFAELIAYEFYLQEEDGSLFNVGRVFPQSEIITMR